ncbi:MAG: GNAT family N-acetyltransferase [Sneathiella sp.]|nr:GNAT family N-acetyltransferase [Sneathiella sp.]
MAAHIPKQRILHLKTENYDVRTITDDLVTDVMVGWYADTEIMRFMNDPMNLNTSQLKAAFQRYDGRKDIALLIIDKKTGDHIGIFRVHIEPYQRQANSSVLIGNKEYWGKQVVLEVRQHLINQMFKSGQIHKIVGNVRGRNFPAHFNYTKQGFQKEGVRRQHYRNRDGEFEDIVEFGLLREDWEKQQSKLTAENETKK